MSLIKNWVLHLAEIWHSVKTASLAWQTENHPQQTQLRQARLLAEHDLQADLKKKAVQLEHELVLLKTRQRTELELYKSRCQQALKDYQSYLKILAQLKTTLPARYPDLPEVLNLTVQHHARMLLDKMWESTDFADKRHYEVVLLNLLATLHEETRHSNGDDVKKNLPEKTLALLQRD